MRNANWGCILLSVTIIVVITYLLGGCAYQQVSHSCPKQGHGPCYLCDERIPVLKPIIIYGRKDILNER
jgi:hypothetical protein